MANRIGLFQAQRFSYPQKERAVDGRKRCGDVVIASMLLLILAPLFLFIAVAIKFEGPGPVFVRHGCLGRRGGFDKLKFRTTAYDGEDPAWPEKPTLVGGFLEYTRADALPVIVNVLRGEMSLMDRDANLFSGA